MPSPEHQSAVELFTALGAAVTLETPLEQLRSGYELLGSANPLEDDILITPVTFGGIPCEWVAAPGAIPTRVVQYHHGGGYVMGSLVSHRELAARIAVAADANVLLVDYRLAPENRFPAAVEDATIVFESLLSAGFKAKRIVFAGDSAGGGLTIATLVKLRDNQRPLPCAAVCLSPWIDLEMTGQSIQKNAGRDPVLSGDELALMAEQYLGDQDPRNPLASPIYANLLGLPDLLVHVGTAEVLLDDARRLVETARLAGVEVLYEEFKDLIHVFQHFCATSPEAVDAVAKIGTFIKAHTA